MQALAHLPVILAFPAVIDLVPAAHSLGRLAETNFGNWRQILHRLPVTGLSRFGIKSCEVGRSPNIDSERQGNSFAGASKCFVTLLSARSSSTCDSHNLRQRFHRPVAAGNRCDIGLRPEHGLEAKFRDYEGITTMHAGFGSHLNCKAATRDDEDETGTCSWWFREDSIAARSPDVDKYTVPGVSRVYGKPHEIQRLLPAREWPGIRRASPRFVGRLRCDLPWYPLFRLMLSFFKCFME